MSSVTDPALSAIAISPSVPVPPAFPRWPMVATLTVLSVLCAGGYLVGDLGGLWGPLRQLATFGMVTIVPGSLIVRRTRLVDPLTVCSVAFVAGMSTVIAAI